MLVTLVGDKQVKEGNEFIYVGPLTDCKDCRLKAVCFNLDAGRKYKIKSLRGVRHDCKIHEEGVQVVEVEAVPMTIALNGKSAIEGSTVTYEFPKCDDVSCETYRLCRPIAMGKGGRAKILRVGKDLKCPRGYELKKVTIE